MGPWSIRQVVGGVVGLVAALGALGGAAHAGDDPARAKLDKACTAGKASDCIDLAMMWANGDRGPEDQVKAGQFFKKACDLNEPQG